MSSSRFRRDHFGVDTHPPIPETDERVELSPWQWLDELTINKTPLRTAKSKFLFKSYNPRMMNRVLCGDSRTIGLVEDIVSLKHLQEPENHYEFLFNTLQKTKHYCKWYFSKEDEDLSSLRKEFSEVYELGSNDFYSVTDNRFPTDRLREVLNATKGGKGKK